MRSIECQLTMSQWREIENAHLGVEKRQLRDRYYILWSDGCESIWRVHGMSMTNE